jgi:hypothetical protein
MGDQDLQFRCEYVLDPDERDELGLLTDDDLDDGVWRCPHERRADDRFCPFHERPSEVDDDHVTEAFRRVVAGERPTAEDSKNAKQFVGATFGTLELEHVILDSGDRRPIDLRYARVTGDVRATAARIQNPVNAAGLVVEGETGCRNATFEDGVGLHHAVFAREAAFSGATFAAETVFADATFGGQSLFRQTTFRDGVRFDGATFRENAKFTTATFGGNGIFRNTEFRGYGWFDGATFEADAHFLSGTAFEGKAWFKGVVVEGLARFRNVTFGDEARFHEATFEDVSIRPTGEGDGTLLIDLKMSDIVEGSLDQSDGLRTIYDVEKATLGDVAVNADAEPLAHLDVFDTTFDGFDFGRREHRESLEASDWAIHEIVTDADEGVRSDADPKRSDASGLEVTYLKAKNGAKRVGYDKAAAEFFRRQMIHRRRAHGRRALTADNWWTRTKAAGRWAANGLFGLAAGHGERPSRVVGLSITVVLAFAALFAVLWSGTPPYGHSAGFLLLSLESFVTLVLGGAAEVRNPWWLRLVAEVEGFVGVFLVALFVFTLTRSIER